MNKGVVLSERCFEDAKRRMKETNGGIIAVDIV